MSFLRLGHFSPMLIKTMSPGHVSPSTVAQWDDYLDRETSQEYQVMDILKKKTDPAFLSLQDAYQEKVTDALQEISKLMEDAMDLMDLAMKMRQTLQPFESSSWVRVKPLEPVPEK